MWKALVQRALPSAESEAPTASAAPLSRGPFADLLETDEREWRLPAAAKRWLAPVAAGGVAVVLVALALGSLGGKLRHTGPAVPQHPAIATQTKTDKAPAVRVGPVRYTVRQGDTYGSIGARFHLSPHTVRVANRLPLSAFLRPGQVLVIPPADGVYHPIRPGETLSHLAIRYHVSEARLLAANPGLRPQALQLGEKIFIPGADALRWAPATQIRRTLTRGYRKSIARRLATSRSLAGEFGNRIGHLLWPAPGEISSPFGARGTSFHPGIDICNHAGTTIRAARAGVVVASGWNPGGYGNDVDIDHGAGLMTRYAHCARLLVHVGEHVNAGQPIAIMGSTGFSTGPHVHFEVRIAGRAVNPAPYL